MNLPNRLTLLRMILIPIILILMLPIRSLEVTHPWNDFVMTWGVILALSVFAIASFTDFLDGHIARKRGLVTNLGKFLDPIADKVLIIAVLIALVQRERLSAYVPIIILVREFAVTGIRLIAVEHGQIIAASPLGKFKTVTQMLAIVVLMLELGLASLNLLPDLLEQTLWTIGEVSTWVAVIMTILSGLDYYWKNRQLLVEKC